MAGRRLICIRVGSSLRSTGIRQSSVDGTAYLGRHAAHSRLREQTHPVARSFHYVEPSCNKLAPSESWVWRPTVRLLLGSYQRDAPRVRLGRIGIVGLLVGSRDLLSEVAARVRNADEPADVRLDSQQGEPPKTYKAVHDESRSVPKRYLNQIAPLHAESRSASDPTLGAPSSPSSPTKGPQVGGCRSSRRWRPLRRQR